MPPHASSHRHQATGEEVWKRDPSEGSLRNVGGSRVAAVSADWVGTLHFALIDAFGDTAPDLLYRGGYEWGLREMMRQNQLFPRQPNAVSSLPALSDVKPLLESWWLSLANSGWGACTFDLAPWQKGIAFADLKNSAVAAALDGAEQPVCHFFAGLFAGAVSYHAHAERHAVEIECRALGHASCRFVIGSGPEIDSAESWRQQGTGATEIARRLS